jgi:hypothetical protein
LILGQQADHPRAEALDEVEAEAVEVEFFDGQAGIFKHGLIDARVAMAQVGKSSELLAFDHDRS